MTYIHHIHIHINHPKICLSLCFSTSSHHPKKKTHNSSQLHNPQPESHHNIFPKKNKQLTVTGSPFQAPKPPQKEGPFKKKKSTHRNRNVPGVSPKAFSSTKSHRPSLATHNARSRLASCARTDGLQLKPGWVCSPGSQWVASLKLTASLPLKIGKIPKGNEYSNHPFSGAFAVSFREGKLYIIIYIIPVPWTLWVFRMFLQIPCLNSSAKGHPMLY